MSNNLDDLIIGLKEQSKNYFSENFMKGLVDLIDQKIAQAGSGSGLVYKVYSAFLTQSGTDTPVVVTLENTLGNIVWSRQSGGQYRGTLANAFVIGKTIIPPFTNWEGSATTLLAISDAASILAYYTAYSLDVNTIAIDVYDPSFVGFLDFGSVAGITSLFIEARVYA